MTNVPPDNRLADELSKMIVDFSAVERLLENGADINAPNSMGSTPLMLAILEDHAKLALKLIEMGADLTPQNKLAWSAVHYAVSKDNRAALDAMIARGAPLDLQRDDGCTAVLYAIWMDNHPMIEKLIAAGADVLIPGLGNKTPLETVSTGHYHSGMVKLIRDADESQRAAIARCAQEIQDGKDHINDDLPLKQDVRRIKPPRFKR